MGPAGESVRLFGAAITLLAVMAACARAPTAPAARNLLLVTIDTLRADHVGAYGYARAQTPFLDELARSGTLFERAYAPAPITLPSHATILTGRYPPVHGARNNGMRMSDAVPTLATELKARGFKTAAFVAAFPLDHQFGLNRGFDVYGDRLPRDPAGHLANERPASQVVDEAIDWLGSHQPPGAGADRFFLWIHLFEPHAPYGKPGDGRPALARYDDEIGVANRELMRLWPALGGRAAEWLVVAAGDHGEAFGEHGEYAHSIFVYDTTLRVPLIVRGPGVPARDQRQGIVVHDAVSLADIAPTAMRLLGFDLKDTDGVDISPSVAGRQLPDRELYAESFAPTFEFGWAPLQTVRSGAWKYIAAPKAELYDIEHDAEERQNLLDSRPDVASRLDARLSRYSSESLAPGALMRDPAAADRLRALGYSAGSGSSIGNPQSPIRKGLPDPKDRRDLAARIAQVTSGELAGEALLSALDGIVREDPHNGQAHLRLGYLRAERGDCKRAEPEFQAAISAGIQAADAFLGLAGCLGQRGNLAGAESALNEARRLEPDNPVILANFGILKAGKGDSEGAIKALSAAVAADPGLLEARFNLVLAYARAGRRSEAASTARELLNMLPRESAQRGEVERLLKALGSHQ